MSHSLDDASRLASASQDGRLKVVAFVNFKSGGRKGKVITNILKQEIGEENVYNLAETNPERVLLNLADAHPPGSEGLPSAVHAIACGGDGTVNWVLSTVSLHTARLAHLNVRIGILPLGTGNDTSRFFGWGKRITSDVSARMRLRKMASIACPSKPFDRWTVILTHKAGVNMHPLLDRMPTIDKATYENLCESPYVHDTLKDVSTFSLDSLPTQAEGAKNNNAVASTPISTIVESPGFEGSNPSSGTQTISPMSHLDDNNSSQVHLQEKENDEEKTSLSPKSKSNRSEEDYPLDMARDISVENMESSVFSKQFVEASVSPRDAMEHSYIHRICSFNNYFSFGIDAQIMASFHHQRESCSWLFCCRCCTMTWVGLWSPLNCCCSCGSIPLHLSLSVLQKNVKSASPASPSSNSVAVNITKDLEPFGSKFSWVPSSVPAKFLDKQSALVLLNIPSYAGGRDIWGTKKEEKLREKQVAMLATTEDALNDVSEGSDDILHGPSNIAAKSSDYLVSTLPASTNDGLLEMCSFSSYNHMNNAVLELFGSRSTRLDQVLGLRIAINGGFRNEHDGSKQLPGVYVQMDGEAWVQDSGYIELIRAQSVHMLFNDDVSLM